MAKNAVFSLLILITTTFISSVQAQASFNVVDYGAKSDGVSDSAGAFLAAWSEACRSRQPANVYVPPGTYYVSTAEFAGPCNNPATGLVSAGTIVASPNFSADNKWISFLHVGGLRLTGGTIDGRGQELWACKKAGKSCPHGSTALIISHSNNVVIDGINLVNSEMFHMAIQRSNDVTIRSSIVSAPGDSPNTDGIHIHNSNNIAIVNSTITTGDDCISMGPGVTNTWIENITCGPGHGISIGSLGQSSGEEAVENVTVRATTFTGTQNGLRIKTWAQRNVGYVRGIVYQNAVMNNVDNPIIIDQNYCPRDKDCPTQGSGIKISDVTFSNVRGTSATEVAIKLDCSPTNPCTEIALDNIRLTHNGGVTAAKSFCRHASGTASGVVIPPSCL
ncbi:hypothetical protein HPP92_023411 [Vanilla planifolia]|uniref:Exopolygalacturonase n=1 Tax=Vanilla planifolia TaxID=51239 RepID=A0A835UGC0_VANPL|nr:hypothetical protein HPP92_023411 [Vanilla planifolia]